jgi:hypothetical protein
MTRLLALPIAVLLICLGLTSVGVAAELDRLNFQLVAAREGRLHLSLSDDGERNGRSSSSFEVSELQELNRAALAGSASSPVRFALVREPGRVDCAGSGRNQVATGHCRFTPDAGFSDLLARRGIGRPSEREAFALTMVGASRRLVEGMAAARYPAPSIDDLTALAAIGVTPAYIAELAAGGYQPAKTSDLIAFKALGVTPGYLASLRGVGYGRLSGSEVVQLKALGVTADYIAGLQRLGYRNLPVGKLIETKAMGVTPDNLRSLRSGGRMFVSADELIRLRLAGLLP